MKFNHNHHLGQKLVHLKRLLTFLLCLTMFTGFCPQNIYPIQTFAAPAWPANVSISAEGGIVMDADSGTVLYGKNIHEAYYPASITKILTALIVIENCDLDEIVTYSHNAVYNVEAGSSSAGIDEGDQLTVRDSLYAMLLKSANEAANGLAEHTAGSIEDFAVMMNEKAASLGCTDSHFVNPSGLNDPEHYTSAYDMALIAQAAFQNETFTEIDSTLYYDIPPTKKNPEGIRVYPGHKMLKKNTSQYYPGIVGGKTGYTSLAGNTLVTCAARDDMKLITVILNGQQTHYADTKTLLDFGFDNFKSLRVADRDTTYTSVENDMTIAGLPTTKLSVLRMQENCRITLPEQAEFTDAVSDITYELPASAPANAVAQISYDYNGRRVGTTYLMRNTPYSEEAETIADVAATAEETYAEGNASVSGEESAAAFSRAGATMDSDTLPNPPGESLTEAESTDAPIENMVDPSGKDTGFRLHIPRVFWIVLVIILAAGGIISGLIVVKTHIEKKEEEERLARYHRRQQRLQDIGMSSADFDLLMQEKRNASSSVYSIKKAAKKPRKHKSFLDKKRPLEK